MRRITAMGVLCAVALCGCAIQHPGSQTLVFNPFHSKRDGGMIQEGNGESNRFWRQATGQRQWGEGDKEVLIWN